MVGSESLWKGLMRLKGPVYEEERFEDRERLGKDRKDKGEFHGAGGCGSRD